MAEKVSVLAFEKKLVPSDGRMYGTNWEARVKTVPLKLQEKSVRGTISNRLKPAIKNDPAKLNAEVEKANLQTVDVCALETDHDTLKLHFTLKILGGLSRPSACNHPGFTAKYQEAVNNYIDQKKFDELAKRYAVNIANARFLWRNRVGAEEIEVEVKELNKWQEQTWSFNSKKIGLREFVSDNPDINSLAERIAAALSSDDDFLMLEVTCFAKVGKAQEVYPSEELVMDKGNGKKSKVLYDVDGIAAMHSQKIGNALRTIDTWYPEYSKQVGPIAIEPYGSVTNMGKAFRNPGNNQDFYTLFDKFAWGEKLDRIEDEHYVMAVLVRGGVFGESEKQ